jgi:exodeoxyribonuclease V alpha subunit
LANITLPGQPSSHLLADAHCQLQTSYRFKDDQGIGQLAHHLRHNKPLQLTNNDEVTFVSKFDANSLLTAMSELYQPYLDLCRQSAPPETLIEAFDRARLLTPVREGEYGVNQLNTAFENRAFADAPDYYHGKPIMIMSNHYALRLFNGDIGICVKRIEGQKTQIEVAFKNAAGDIEYYLPTRLPQHTTCFAMTVHKSQGSEFDEVMLVLPETSREDFITRELLYTGITRTRARLSIFTAGSLQGSRAETRFSGLALRFIPVDIDAASTETPGTETLKKDQLDLF